MSTTRARLALVLLLSIGLLAACANPAIEEAGQLARQGQQEAALRRLQQATEQDQDDKRLRNAMLQQRDVTVSYLVAQADAARSAGRIADLEVVLARLEAAAPTHPRVAWLRTEVARIKRHDRLVAEAQQSLDAERFEKAETALRTVLTEDPANGKARAMLSRIEELREGQTRRQGSLQLATGQKPVTLEFREASLRTVFEALARAADINFVFDKDVRSDAKVTLFLRGTSVDEAMRVILSTQQLGYKLLNENTVLVFPATQQKQRDVLDTVTRTFYLVNADPKQAQSLVRTVAKTRDIYVDERLNLLVVRDTPEVMRLVERLIQNIDLADPEVMLELEVMEVSHNQLESLGISWPASASYGLADGSKTIAARSTGLQAFITNPLAVATLTASGADTNILANPKIRARNREKAHVLLGEKLPVFTTTSTPLNGGVSNAVSVSYIDVGLKLDVEPQVQLDNDVTIKVALEVSSITNTLSSPDKSSIAYQVGTRQANTTLRLKDGETQVLAGLINDTESHSTAGLPYLHNAPVLGRLFGLTTDEKKKTEIVLLVTPHIIRNLVQPAVSGTALPSGTESQPGAATMVLRESAAMSGVGTPGEGGDSAPRSIVARSRGRALKQALAGPEEVLPGASFTVSVRNPGNTPMQATVSVDPTVLAIESPQAQSGRLAVNVPPGGTETVMVHVLPGVVDAETSIELDNGQEPLKLRVRAAPGEPGANPAAAAPMGFDPDSPNPQ